MLGCKIKVMCLGVYSVIVQELGLLFYLCGNPYDPVFWVIITIFFVIFGLLHGVSTLPKF